MALTLDPTLKTNQDGNDRHPLIEILSKSAVDAIPMAGSALTGEDVDSSAPASIVHSSGRIALCYACGPDGTGKYQIKYLYSDEDESFFTTVSLGTASTNVISYIALCELEDETIGVAWLEKDASYYRLKRRIVDVYGASISTAEIATWRVSIFTGGLAVCKLHSVNFIAFTNPASSEATSRDVVDAYSESIITATEEGIESTLSAPTVTADGQTFIVANSNLSAYAIEVNGIVIGVGKQITFTWNELQAEWDAGAPADYIAPTVTYMMVYAKASGSEYYCYKRTSPDFAAWSSETALIIGGLTTANSIHAPSLMYDTPRETLWLWFSVQTSPNIYNIFYSTSTDNGSTWAAAVQYTTYATQSAVGKHPVSALKSSSQMFMAYNEEKPSLSACETPAIAGYWPSGIGYCGLVHYNPATRKLYVVPTINWLRIGYYGLKSMKSIPGVTVIEIDVDTWSYVKKWSGNTVFHQLVIDSGISANSINDGPYALIGSTIVTHLLDANNDEVFSYYWADNSEYSITRNISPAPVSYSIEYGRVALVISFIDTANDRIWCLINERSFNNRVTYELGYFKISERAASTKTWYSLMTFVVWAYYPSQGIYNKGMKVYSDADFAIISVYFVRNARAGGELILIKLSTGEIYKTYHREDEYTGADGTNINVVASASLPLGFCCFAYLNGCIYAAPYEYRDGDGIGICRINVSDDTMTWFDPDVADGITNYRFYDAVAIDATRIAFMSYDYGIYIFDTSDLTWNVLNNTTQPGIFYSNGKCLFADCDREAGVLFVAAIENNNLYALSVDGLIKRAKYAIGTYAGGAWSWGAAGNLVSALIGYDSEIASNYLPGLPWSSGDLTCFWVGKSSGKLIIRWGSAAEDFNLADWLVRGTDLELSWHIDGTFNSLAFTLANGHLFDPYNASSLFSLHVKKGRQLTVRLGERIAGVEYWQNQGTFVVTERKMSGYQRGKYPTMQVRAEDVRTLWQFKNIIASDYYNGVSPTGIIEGLLDDNGTGFADAADFVWPAIANNPTLYHQFVDTALLDAVDQLIDRIGHFLKITVDNKVSAGKIALDNAVNHLYADSAQLLSLSPDDSFSDFTNKVIVIGQERDFTEVLYDEQRVGSLNGTFGWWGRKNTYDVYYSEDKSAICRNARLVVVETSASIGFKLGGSVSESIAENDPNERYCVVTVKAPNLIPALIIAIAVYVAAACIPDIVIVVGFIASSGTTIPIGRMIQAAAMVVILNILGAVGNFQLEIWAQPVGQVRKSVQGIAEDEDLQAEIGDTIPQILEDPFCYTVEDCVLVARHEIDVLSGQRNRVKISKISHLQDEAGDRITIPHPYSGLSMDIFITDLSRKYRIPAGVAEEASCVDEIEGWVLP